MCVKLYSKIERYIDTEDVWKLSLKRFRRWNEGESEYAEVEKDGYLNSYAGKIERVCALNYTVKIERQTNIEDG